MKKLPTDRAQHFLSSFFSAPLAQAYCLLSISGDAFLVDFDAGTHLVNPNLAALSGGLLSGASGGGGGASRHGQARAALPQTIYNWGHVAVPSTGTSAVPPNTPLPLATWATPALFKGALIGASGRYEIHIGTRNRGSASYSLDQ